MVSRDTKQPPDLRLVTAELEADRRAELEAQDKTKELREETDRFHRMTDQMRAAEQRNRILSLVRNGATGEQICEILARSDPPMHTTPAHVSAVVKKYLNRVHTEDALTIEQLRVLENERLDALWAKLSAALVNADGTPNLKVADRLTRLSERRSKMNGLDAAQKHEHFVGDGLLALGLEQEHVERARQAFQTTYIEQGVTDVTVEGEAEEMDE